jgi:hypothetical protein
MSGHISKIERVDAPQRGSELWVDLLLDKRTGVFFADVNGKRVEAKSKDDAVKLVREALAAVTQVAWRQVLLIRVRERNREDRDDGGSENNKAVFSASCDFVYLRRERAANPLNPKETIERDHQEDFEVKVKDARKREAYFERTSSEKKKRSDAVETRMRQERDALSHVGAVWDHFNKGTTEYELPYTPEAWAGVRRIAQTIHETQDRLDAFARTATPDKLLALATSGAGPLLLAVASNEKKS